MLKLPWFKFSPTLWTSDTELSKCTPATRGVWIDLLCAMHQSGRSGELCGTTDQIARLARCSTAELTQALTELQTTGTADVTFRNNNVTVINRLMKREAKDRTGTALRVKKHRGNGKCNNDVTVESIEVRVKEIERSPPLLDSGVTWNIEDDLLKNQIQFEQICMAARKSADVARVSLTKFHLHMVENEKYPRSRKALYAGFQKWLMGEKWQIEEKTTEKTFYGDAAEKSKKYD